MSLQPVFYNPAIMKFQIYFQLQAEAIRRAQTMRNTILASINTKTEQERNITVKSETEIKVEKSEHDSIIMTKDEVSESSQAKIEEPTLSPDSISLMKKTRTEINKMLDFLLYNIGKDNQTQIQHARSRYLADPILLQIYEKLLTKYSSAKKGKEDMIRYILRKAFKTIKTWIMEKEKVNSKKATILFCQRYLQVDAAQLQEEGFNIKNEEDIIEFAMPYNKKSKTKTMNTSFVLEIFRSEPFLQAYQQFLPELNNILVQESLKRKEKFMEFLLDCAKTSNFSKILNYQRLPWLDVWIEDIKNLAIAIMPGKRLIYNFKKTKC